MTEVRTESAAMKPAEVGARVGAVLDAHDQGTRFLGYGVYEGSKVPDGPNLSSMARELQKRGIPNPTIKLDNGKTVYGCECWWGPEDVIKELLEKHPPVTTIDIDQVRADFEKVIAAEVEEMRKAKQLPAGMDSECQRLCEAINSIDGIKTVESCCGHGKTPYHVFFQISSDGGLDSLRHLVYWLDGCHSGFYGWKCTVGTDCGKAPVTFVIEGPQGDEAYTQADEIANRIMKDTDIPREPWIK